MFANGHRRDIIAWVETKLAELEVEKKRLTAIMEEKKAELKKPENLVDPGVW